MVGDAAYLGAAYVLADRGADAVRVLEPAVERNSGVLFNNVVLVAAYVAAGRQQEAERQAEIVRRRFPTLSSQFGALLRELNQREKLGAMLKKAGL